MSRHPARAALRPQVRGPRLALPTGALRWMPRGTGCHQVRPRSRCTLPWTTSGSRTSRRRDPLFTRRNQPNGKSPHPAGSEVKVRAAHHCSSTAPPRSHIRSARGLVLPSGVTVCSLSGHGGWLAVVGPRHDKATSLPNRDAIQEAGWKNEGKVRDPRDRVSETSQSGQPEGLLAVFNRPVNRACREPMGQ